MMNDALECYLILKHGRMTGEYLDDFDGEMAAEVVMTENGPAVICRQGLENVFTIWFEDAFRELQCYRYDQIGHFWVQGQEQWRRLVYIIGTIHDKYNYMGESVCNEKEMALMPLMEFAPFRYFSPIHEPLDEYYSDSVEGLECMEALSREAGDRWFLLLMRVYKRFAPGGLLKQGLVQVLSDSLSRPGRNRLYQLIFEKVREASIEYPERKYPSSLEEEIQAKRAVVCEQMRQSGFIGEYPLFEREKVQILAMEEHPFTILESDQYKFKIQYMVSEVNHRNHKRGQNKEEAWLNAGFFKKRGNRGWIARDLSFMK